MKQLNKKVFGIVAGIYVLLVIAVLIITGLNGGALDLAFSKKFADVTTQSRYSKNVIGIIIEIFIPFITYLLIGLGFISIGYVAKDFKNKALSISIQVIGLVFGVLVFTYGTHDVIGYFVDNSLLPAKWEHLFNVSLVLKLGLGLVFTGITYLILTKLKPNNVGLLRFAIVTLVICFVPTLFINVLVKPMLPRSRYRAMMYLDNGSFEYFTAWFTKGVKRLDVVNAMKDDFKSFPSGHSCSAALIFTLTLLPYYFVNANKRRTVWILFTLSTVVTVISTFYRIRVGAHFLSDVTMGSFLAILSVYLFFALEQLLFKKKPNLFQNLF